jgi:iron complex transport system ATP-binding protein
MYTDNTISYTSVMRQASVKNAPDILRAQNLSIGYKAKGKVTPIGSALELTLQPGQFVCLLGPNGAGKSTLIRTLAGIQNPLQGKVYIGGVDVNIIQKTTLAQKLSLVLAENVQAGNLNVYTVLTLGRYPYADWFGTLRNHDKVIIKEAIRATGIEKYLDKQIHQLSDGERQKVMITRALVQDTPLIILDEPTAHLDLPNRVEIIRLLRRMARQTKKAILLSTHELDLALQTADKIWLMMPNQSLITGTPEDLILNGTFEKAFHRSGFDFCRETGTFKVNTPEDHKRIQLKGDGTLYFWTRRALEREGFHITESSETVLYIQEHHHEHCWVFESEGTAIRFNTIESIIEYLRDRFLHQESTFEKV